MTPDALARSVVLVPALQAGPTIGGVLDRVPRALLDGLGAVLVVDNASEDDTRAQVEAFVKRSGFPRLTYVRNPRNLGYGGSQQLAYRWCLDRGFSFVAMLHADGQYPSELLPAMFAPLHEGSADMVFGSRMAGAPLKGGMPVHRFLGNRFLTVAQNRLLSMGLSEYHSGFRAYSLDVLGRLPFERLSPEFHFDTEVILLLHRADARIVEAPIPTRYADEPNFVNIWAYGLNVLASTVSYVLHERGVRRSGNWSRILAPRPDQPVRSRHRDDDPFRDD